ncbi:MAG TPA: fluoride efflux transporter CrcB [Clostridia bacterium]|nr:fluoride efflux transporter CrcB [Clostridia bacterium]
MTFFLVGIGGAIGAICRYAISLISINWDFPIKTLVINFFGSFLIGLFAGLFDRINVSSNIKLFTQVGICGGFTTFSAFSLENLTMLENKEYGKASIYIFVSVVSCVLGVWLGKSLVKVFA